jgi:hypothetical protein
MSPQVVVTLTDDLYAQAQHWAALPHRELPQLLTQALALVLTPIGIPPADAPLVATLVRSGKAIARSGADIAKPGAKSSVPIPPGTCATRGAKRGGGSAGSVANSAARCVAKCASRLGVGKSPEWHLLSQACTRCHRTKPGWPAPGDPVPRRALLCSAG